MAVERSHSDFQISDSPSLLFVLSKAENNCDRARDARNVIRVSAKKFQAATWPALRLYVPAEPAGRKPNSPSQGVGLILLSTAFVFLLGRRTCARAVPLMPPLYRCRCDEEWHTRTSLTAPHAGEDIRDGRIKDFFQVAYPPSILLSPSLLLPLSPRRGSLVPAPSRS